MLPGVCGAPWKIKKWKCVNFKCYSSEELITLNTLHEVVPTWYSFHSWVDWSNADKVSSSRRKHFDAGDWTVNVCIQGRHSNHYTMECNLSAAWTSNCSLLVVFRVMVFPGIPTNSGSTQPRATYLVGGVIECHMCPLLAHGKCSGISRHAINPSWLCLACIPTAAPSLPPHNPQ